jgi:hypothetical protein
VAFERGKGKEGGGTAKSEESGRAAAQNDGSKLDCQKLGKGGDERRDRETGGPEFAVMPLPYDRSPGLVAPSCPGYVRYPRFLGPRTDMGFPIIGAPEAEEETRGAWRRRRGREHARYSPVPSSTVLYWPVRMSRPSLVQR